MKLTTNNPVTFGAGSARDRLNARRNTVERDGESRLVADKGTTGVISTESRPNLEARGGRGGAARKRTHSDNVARAQKTFLERHPLIDNIWSLLTHRK